MTIAHLFDNTVGPPTVNYPGTASHTGMAFDVSADCHITKLGYYKGDANANNVPTNIRLWDKVTGSLLRDAETIPGVGEAAGWKWHTLTVPYEATLGQDFVVSLYRAGSIPNVTIGTGSVGNAPSPLNFLDKSGDYQASADPDIMPTTDHGVATWVDVEADTALAPDTSEELTVLGLQNVLTSWLTSSGDNTHQTDLPWLTHVQAQLAATKAEHADDEIVEMSAALAIPAGQTLWPFLGTLATTVGLSALGAVVDNIVNNLLGNTGQDSVHEQLQAIATQTSTNSRPEDQIAVGGTGWTLTDTQIGNGSIAHRFAADAYILTIDAVGAHVRQETLVDDVVIFYMRGFAWWLNGSAVGHRQELNALENVIRQPGTRYPGVLIDVPPDVGWTLTSWDYTG